ncbi:RagB/SusD family nutrient uptake outer membrane protein [Pedobacter sp.]|uniref:RagB/SusD family nutrient uptake outer membrane protein n=1 Tax=Pedobacter sp. TaxID=1411316 RepID=UPI002C87F04F|nr:RagB/SusD family nutrient uptake outer membrane protein [Pedobacter sp.]HWW40474.1 RagB/SusD family nutrient uptake outer membrane protein [Pedobacter sp.]
MKRYIFMLIALASLSAGCKKFLDQPIIGRQNTDNYFKTEADCQAAVIACYFGTHSDQWYELDRSQMMGDALSDDAFKGNSIPGDQSLFGDIARYHFDATNEWFGFRWSYLWKGIGNCNFAIEGISTSTIDDALKQKLIAEAKFLRAYCYFELVKSFGGVPLVLNVPDPQAVLSVARSSKEECFAQIVKDLSDAAAVLPERAAQGADQIGRATKGAANAYLAKAYLFTENWAQAQKYADQVIASAQYTLEPSFSNVWSVRNKNGVESIFEFQYNADQTFNLGTALTTLTRSRADGGWGFDTPSSHLEQAFLKENDPRLKWTIIKQGDNVGAATPNFDYSHYDTKLSENESGRISRKFYLAPADRPANELSHAPLNIIQMRYADLLLIDAEAAYRNGNEAVALKSLNMVRERANRLNPGAVLPRSSSGTQLLNDIWLERRLELAMEGHRYYDLVRQHRLVQVIKDFYTYNNSTSTDPYDKGNPKGADVAEKHNLFPIPQQDIDLSKGVLKQNPGF